MIYFIHGPDTYRSKMKLKELIKNYQPEFELQKINGEKITLDEFGSKINAISLLSSKRLLVIENLSQNNEQKNITDFLKEKNINHSLTPSLKRRGDNEPNDLLIFYEEKVNKITSLYKFLVNPPKGGKNFVFEFNQLKPFELKKWAQDYVKNNPEYSGGKIEVVALEELLMSGKNDLWFLSRELDKLLAYDKHITLANAQLLTAANFDDNIFNLTDVIGMGNKAKALELLNQQLDSGTEPLYLLSMIIRQFRILIQIKEVVGKQNFPNHAFVAKELSLHPFVVQKSIPQAQKYSFQELEKIYHNLLKIDCQLKSSKLSPELLFNKLVISN